MEDEILELEEALTGDSGSKGGSSSGSGSQPDFRVVQPMTDKNGNTKYVQVGAMWKNVSKNGNEFYTLKIGNLRLLVFPQDRK